MRFRLEHNDRIEKLNANEFNRKENLMISFKWEQAGGWKSENKVDFFESMTRRIRIWFPDEVTDFDMKAFPEGSRINYAILNGDDTGGELPDDLTVTETVLTEVLWGQRDKDIAVLLVAALENMEIQRVKENFRKLNFF
jgi:hypothetical protein